MRTYIKASLRETSLHLYRHLCVCVLDRLTEIHYTQHIDFLLLQYILTRRHSFVFGLIDLVTSHCGTMVMKYAHKKSHISSWTCGNTFNQFCEIGQLLMGV